MNGKTLLPDPSLIKLERFVSSPDAIIVVIKTKQPQASCSLCQQPSQKIHSRYVRRLADLPWQGVAIRLELTVRRFFCINDDCQRKIFAEQIPSIVKRYARKTARLNDALTLIGFAIGGEAGARVAKSLSMITSPDTLLRRLRQSILIEHPTPKVLGVDDWAFRKGQRYGTILVDLEKRCPIDLLKDREAETLRSWLVSHPGVEIVSRDRAFSYAEGARKGVPDAVQIADRWHLLKNLREVLERLFCRKHALLKQAYEVVSKPTREPLAEVNQRSTEDSNLAKLSRVERDSCQRRERRVARYQAVREKYQQGETILGIAKQFGMHRRTVRQFVRAESYPERTRPPKRFSKLDQYARYLKQRWDEGCHNGTQLHTELVEKGFRGSASAVRNRMKSWRVKGVRAASSAPGKLTKSKPISPRKTFWLLTGKAKAPTPEEQKYVEKLTEISPEIKTAQALAIELYEIVKGRKREKFDAWIELARQSKLPEMQGFLQGLNKDINAVKAALEYEWSNGQVEGQVNRLKTIKRQMYGRANFDLLRAKVLHSV
jgi:transposase